MPIRVYRPRRVGKGIPDAVQVRTERRILDYANQHCAGKFTRIDVSFRGAFCYIDAYVEPGTPLHLCRIRYCGSEDRWAFAFYSYAHEKYEPSFPMSGDYQSTPEEAFETSTLFY
jgi:hypothetical protein